jgi:hypothetical protein
VLAHCRHARRAETRLATLELLALLSAPSPPPTHTITDVSIARTHAADTDDDDDDAVDAHADAPLALLSAEAVACRVLPYAIEFIVDARPLVRQAAVRAAVVAFARGRVDAASTR